jgi:hypothetical protein
MQERINRKHRANQQYCNDRNIEHIAHLPAKTDAAEMKSRSSCYTCDALNDVFPVRGSDEKPMFVAPIVKKRRWGKQSQYQCRDRDRYTYLGKNGAVIRSNRTTATVLNSNGCCINKIRSNIMTSPEAMAELVEFLNRHDEFKDTIILNDEQKTNVLRSIYKAASSTFAHGAVVWDAILDHTSLGTTVLLTQHLLGQIEIKAARHLQNINDIQLEQDGLSYLQTVDETPDKLLTKAGKVTKYAAEKITRVSWWIVSKLISYTPFVMFFGSFFAKFLDSVNSKFSSWYFREKYTTFEVAVDKAYKKSPAGKNISSCDIEISEMVDRDVRANIIRYNMIYMGLIEKEMKKSIDVDSLVAKINSSAIVGLLDSRTLNLFSKFLATIVRLIGQMIRKVVLDTLLQGLRATLSTIDMSDFYIRFLGDLKRFRVTWCSKLTVENALQFVYRTISDEKPSLAIRHYSEELDERYPFGHVTDEIRLQFHQTLADHTDEINERRRNSIDKVRAKPIVMLSPDMNGESKDTVEFLHDIDKENVQRVVTMLSGGLIEDEDESENDDDNDGYDGYDDGDDDDDE